MRRPLGTTAPAISLFPFLAVLLCTMGALIVVLVVLNRQSRLLAATLAAADRTSQSPTDDERRAEEELQREALAWQLGHLRESRDKTQVDLDHARLRLSGVEEHRRNMESRLAELKREASRLEALNVDGDPSATARDELVEINRAVEAAQKELDETRRRVGKQAQTYSVVPYEGPNRTARRPIYIECCDDRVIIQPEGIVLAASDFAGPPGPGNPLASAVRAARDHIVAAAPDPKSPDAEPYPLFLVRPDGIAAYYAARAAMASWGADFGYQTIDQDWTLEFPPLDARLAEAERQAVDEARDRLRWLAQMSPDRYGAGGERRGGGNQASYRVSPLGGLIREGGPALRDDAGVAMGSGRLGSAHKTRTNPAAGLSMNRAGEAGAPTPTTRTPHQTSTTPNDDGDSQTKAASAPRETAKGRASASRSGQPNALGTPNGDAAAVNSAASSERRYGDLNDRAVAERGSPDPFSEQATSKTDPETGETQAQVSLQQQSKVKPRSLAEVRGANWGLSAGARLSNPITRPIHVVCEGNRLVIRPQNVGDPPVEVPLRLRTEESVDPLVAAVQQRIKDWGIAGRGLYWRPQLVLEVGQSGEGRYADLEALMADSGFDVKRKE